MDAEETLDPADWDEFARIAHAMVDDAVAYTRGLRDRPLWRPMPAAVSEGYRAPVPHGPSSLAEVRRELNERLMPYPMGNVHPRFWMWYMGASNLTGALGDFLAAVQGSNLGGGNHAATLMDGQVVDWLKRQPFVDPERIAFYGLSYGGKTAMRVPVKLPGPISGSTTLAFTPASQ